MGNKTAGPRRATRRAALAAAAAGVSALLAACIAPGQARPEAGSPDKTPVQGELAPEIEFFHQHSAAFIDGILDLYHHQQPRLRARGVVVSGGYEGLLQRVQLLVTAGTPPAVAQAGFTYTQFMVKRVPMTPVASFMAVERFDARDIFPAMLKLGQDRQGKQWGLPFAVSTPIFYYHAALLQQVGIDPDRPARTWDELRTQGRRIAQGETKGVAFNTRSPVTGRFRPWWSAPAAASYRTTV